VTERAVVQKAITPAMSDAIYRSSYERIAGYAVPAAALDGITDIPDLIDAHALRFPGSPFHEGTTHVDVVRFPAGSNLNIERAIGGTNVEEAHRNGGTFIEHAPFNGTGFVQANGAAIPLYWVPTHRPPVGSELLRYSGSSAPELRARYGGAARGWEFPDALERARPRHGRDLSRYTGGLASVAGQVYMADLVDDVVEIVTTDPAAPAVFDAPQHGVRAARIPTDAVESYFELDVRAEFNGIEFRLTGQRRDDRLGQVLEGTSLTHNVQILEALGLTKIDAGVYEADLPHELLDTAHTEQVQLPGWPGTVRPPS